MLTTLMAILVLIIEVALAAFVAARAWGYRPARLFFYLTAAVLVVISATILRDQAESEALAYVPLSLIGIGIGSFITLLMLLLSALFVPAWWQGAKPVRWIVLPYLVCTATYGLDAVGHFGLIIGGVQHNDTYGMLYAQPGAGLLLAGSIVGQLVSLGILGVAFFNQQHRPYRPIILALAAALIFAIVLPGIVGRISSLARISSLIQTLPILIVLGYAIIGTRLFRPTRAALDMALDVLHDAVVVADTAGQITYANPSAVGQGLQLGAPLVEQLERAGSGSEVARLVSGTGGVIELNLGVRHFEVTLTPVRDGHAVRRGTLMLARDISELTRRAALLEHERTRLAATVDALAAEQAQRERLDATVRDLSLPVIPVLPGVLILPLIGDFVGTRINEFISVLLRGIEHERARTVLVDITGVAVLDSEGARGLLDGVRAAALLGAHCILVGVRPEVAQALVALGLDLAELATAPTLEQAVMGQLKLGMLSARRDGS